MGTLLGLFFIAILEGTVLAVPYSFVEDVSPADELRDAIHPFNPGRQRSAFLNAAGKDMLLSESEFKKDAEQRTRFVRVYDKWANLLLFDKDKNGELDWLEAQEYRSALKDAVMAKYDLNRNRRLDDLELIDAARDLTRSIIPKLYPPGAEKPEPDRPPMPGMNPSDPGAATNSPDRVWSTLTETQRKAVDQILSPTPPKHENFQPNPFGAFDLDGDGVFSEAEDKVLNDAINARQLMSWDRNRNGVLDDGEWGSILLDRQEQKLKDLQESVEVRVSIAEKLKGLRPENDATGAETRRWLEMQADLLRGQLRLIRQEYDIDGDGVLTESELAAWMHDRKVRDKQYFDRDFDLFDRDQDGRWDLEESMEAYRRKEMLRDANGDGRISVAEEIAWMQRMLEQFDKDKDGILSENEEHEAKMHSLNQIASEK